MAKAKQPKKLIVANWKMHPEKLSEARSLLTKIETVAARHTVVICPPTIYIAALKTKFSLGAQDIFWEETGAHTGAISGVMLKNSKVKYVIIGHSERRLMGDTDEIIKLKLQAALRVGIIPILCVGYNVPKHSVPEDAMACIRTQLEMDLEGIDPKQVIIAYEPVWAIGSGKAETPDNAERIAMFIRIKFGIQTVLYGGSINAYDFRPFLEKEIDGFLIGGASLMSSEFKTIIQG
jgi:triosephosphate isomerase